MWIRHVIIHLHAPTRDLGRTNCSGCRYGENPRGSARDEGNPTAVRCNDDWDLAEGPHA